MICTATRPTVEKAEKHEVAQLTPIHCTYCKNVIWVDLSRDSIECPYCSLGKNGRHVGL